MSSAILFLAIIAIWACVLIPRRLRRDSPHVLTVAPDSSDSSVSSAFTGSDPAALAAESAEQSMTEAGDAGDAASPAASPATGPLPAEPLTAEESRSNMLAARRRLLLMLGGLEVVATALALLGLAAVWVVIPPTIMLAGYLLLLREAAKADAERAAYEAEAAAHDRERARARSLAARRVTPAEGMPAEGVAAAGEKFAAAPVPADYEDGGRDFAPGLAGKYTTSNAEAEADEEYYGYEVPRLRAVGD